MHKWSIVHVAAWVCLVLRFYVLWGGAHGRLFSRRDYAPCTNQQLCGECSLLVPTFAMQADPEPAAAVSAEELGAEGGLICLDALSHGDSHRVLMVHASSGACVWDLRRAQAAPTLQASDKEPSTAEIQEQHGSPKAASHRQRLLVTMTGHALS